MVAFLSSFCLRIKTLRTLDVSKNKLKNLAMQLSEFKELKSFNCDENLLTADSLKPLSSLPKLQNLSVGGNQLGRAAAGSSSMVPSLPPSLKQLKLDNNRFSSLPPSITSPVSHCLAKLEKLIISHNNLACIPTEIQNLVNLTELNADSNVIVSLPESIGKLIKLKTLSLKDNKLSVGKSTTFSNTNPQPLPKSLFADTLLIDLNLHGNPMTSTELNCMDGYDAFMDRRQKVKTKDIYGGALTNLDVCGLP